MPYTTVVAGTTITAAWGNANVRDQVVTPFATAAARTSAITSPIQGMLSYRNDLGLNGGFEHYSGSAWVPAGAQKINESLLGGTQASITFASIPGGYSSLLLRGIAAANNAATNNVDCTIQINGDTGTNYSMNTWDSSQAAANPAGSFTNANTSLIWGLAVPGAGFGATRAGVFTVEWPGYATTTLSKVSTHDMFMTDSGTSYNTHKRWGFWKSSSAITQLVITCGGGGSFIAGSYFGLYGMP